MKWTDLDKLQIAFLIFMLIIVIALFFFYVPFYWNECLSVGHSKLYCFLRMG